MKYFIGMVFVVLVSCATYKAAPPSTAATQKTVKKDVLEVYRLANLWLLENDFTVVFKDVKPYQIVADGDIKKLSGTSYSVWGGAEQKTPCAHCGSWGASTFLPQTAKIVLTFDSLAVGTKANCKMLFKPSQQISGELLAQIKCESTGMLETSLFNYLEGK